MEALRKLRADLEAWFSGLAPRERVLVSAAGVAVVAFIMFLGAVKVQRGIAAREANIDRKTQVLAQVGKLAQGYRQAQAERAQLEAKLKGPPLQLMSFVAQTGQRLGIEVNDLRPSTSGGASAADKVVEDTVEVNLARRDLPRQGEARQGRLDRVLDHLVRRRRAAGGARPEVVHLDPEPLPGLGDEAHELQRRALELRLERRALRLPVAIALGELPDLREDLRLAVDVRLARRDPALNLHGAEEHDERDHRDAGRGDEHALARREPGEPRLEVGPELAEGFHALPPPRRLLAGVAGEIGVDRELELAVARPLAGPARARVAEAARGAQRAHDLVHVLGGVGGALEVELVARDLDAVEP